MQKIYFTGFLSDEKYEICGGPSQKYLKTKYYFLAYVSGTQQQEIATNFAGDESMVRQHSIGLWFYFETSRPSGIGFVRASQLQFRTMETTA